MSSSTSTSPSASPKSAPIHCYTNSISAGLAGLAVGIFFTSSYNPIPALFRKAKSSVAALFSGNRELGKYDYKNMKFNEREWDAIVKDFTEQFPVFEKAFVDRASGRFEMDGKAADRIKRVLQYNCIGGKYFRGVLSIESAKELCKFTGKQYTESIRIQALACAVAVEALQAAFLVADDIMDKSITRRGQPCWYLQPDVQMDAINDVLILESFVYFLVQEYIEDATARASVLQLFMDVSFATQLGQMLDLGSQPQGDKSKCNLATFTDELYGKIVKYKTALYTFYLPIASVMHICGVNSGRCLDKAKDLCVQIGTLFQIQDDYLDLYGDYTKMGKVGTDVKDHKCSWLVVQALKKAQNNDAHMKVLKANYGKDEDINTERIKTLYKELQVEGVFHQTQDTMFTTIMADIDGCTSYLPPSLFVPILNKIYKREK